jgi:hypothetical protein
MTKRWLSVLLISLVSFSGLVHADNDRWQSRSYGEGRHFSHEDREHRGEREGFRRFRNDWDFSPLAAAAVIGTTVYLANSIANMPSATVTVSPPVQYSPPKTAYFCPASQQYYPSVPTCPLPWQLVNY